MARAEAALSAFPGAPRWCKATYGVHPIGLHAPQQLGRLPRHAVPPFRGLHAAGPRSMLQLAAPRALVRQQLTNPGLPQADLAAHRLIGPLQSFGSIPALAASLAIRAAHLTYAP